MTTGPMLLGNKLLPIIRIMILVNRALLSPPCDQFRSVAGLAKNSLLDVEVAQMLLKDKNVLNVCFGRR